MKKYFLFIAYVFLALLVRKEFHPFSRFPMYDRFPDWAYVFFLKNERNEPVFFNHWFSYSKHAGNLAHTFFTLVDHHGFLCCTENENPEQMATAGKEMLEMTLKNEDIQRFNFDSLGIYRRVYFLHNNQLTHRDELLYAQRVKP